MEKPLAPLSECSAQYLHAELLARAASCPGDEIMAWVTAHEDRVLALLSGSVPGHTWRVDVDGEYRDFKRHRAGLHALRQLAFGRWEPSNVWMLASEDEAIASIAQAVPAWGPSMVVTGSEPGELTRDPNTVELFFDLPKHEPEAAPDEAVKSLREDPMIHEATPLEMHLELLARTQFNRMVGPAVAADLRANPKLWRAAMVGREDSVLVELDGRRVHVAPTWNTLNCLPDEAGEGYNADQLWVIAPDLDAARALTALARARWNCDERRIYNRANSKRTAGCVNDERVVAFWWD